MNGLRVIESQGGLVATGLGKRFKKRPVVRNVSISVKRGEAVGLLGPNGAGKTTTVEILEGLTTPDGMPMVWAGRHCGATISRVYGPDLMHAVLARANEVGWSNYFVGGAPGAI